jgi:hypothetical protein
VAFCFHNNATPFFFFFRGGGEGLPVLWRRVFLVEEEAF